MTLRAHLRLQQGASAVSILCFPAGSAPARQVLDRTHPIRPCAERRNLPTGPKCEIA